LIRGQEDNSIVEFEGMMEQRMSELQVGANDPIPRADENQTAQDDGTRRNSKLERMIEVIETENGNQTDRDKGRLSRLFERINRYFLKDPILEVRKDLSEVQGFADRTRVSVNKNNADPRRRTFARVQAYLNLASREEDLGKAWNYLNSADALLTLVVDPEDLDRCVLRLRRWDEALIRISNTNKEELRVLDNNCLKKKSGCYSPGSTTNEDRTFEYCMQAGRAQLWSHLNTALSRRVTLMHSFKLKLFMGLIFAIVLSEILYFGINPGKPSWYFPFVFVSAFGGFGGLLSSSLIKRESIVEATYVVLLMFWTTSRALLGAAGALVVLSFALWPGLVSGVDIAQLLSENVFVLMSLGIGAGFSEQLYVETLEKSARNMGIAGKGRTGK
jgi:hypothetical protein